MSAAASVRETSLLPRGTGSIAYDVRGDGPLVVLVPGMGDLRSTYRHLAPLLAEAGYRVVTTDLRGHGDSSTAFASWGDEATASDVEALVEALGAPAVVVGNSLAAGSAVLLAAQRPELVAGVVLVGPFVRNPRTSATDRLLLRLMTVPLWAAAAWDAYLPTLYAGRRPDDLAEHRAAIRAALRRPGRTRAFTATVRGADHAAAEAALPHVQAPALVVMGDRDPDFPDPGAEARWIGERLDADVVMIADAGHYPQAQQPGAVADAVLPFLRRALPRA